MDADGEDGGLGSGEGGRRRPPVGRVRGLETRPQKRLGDGLKREGHEGARRARKGECNRGWTRMVDLGEARESDGSDQSVVSETADGRRWGVERRGLGAGLETFGRWWCGVGRPAHSGV